MMDRVLYTDLIEDKFPAWTANSSYLVQDFEGCLHCPEAKAAIKNIGLELVDGYPRSSQDFNACENAWRELRDRLNRTMPKEREGREAFIKRLKHPIEL